MKQHVLQEIAEAPVITGKFGSAWKFEFKEIVEADKDGCYAWLVRAPWAHPMWPDYMVVVASLRPRPGFKDAFIVLPGGTHEIEIGAISPDWRVDLGGKPDTLRPVNFAAQFIAEDDEAAERRALESIKEICDKALNPDTDGRQQWIDRYGDNLLIK